MNALLHFSEDPTIEYFVPGWTRSNREDHPCVWAIDEEHSPLYWFPRDCPRAAWWRLPSTTDADAEKWLGATDARMVFAVESGWLERIRTCRLFVYRFDPTPFLDLNDHGAHLAFETVVPLGPPEPVGDLLTTFAEAGDLELRITPSLWPLEQTLTKTSLHWSFVRMRNASPPRGIVP